MIQNCGGKEIVSMFNIGESPCRGHELLSPLRQLLALSCNSP